MINDFTSGGPNAGPFGSIVDAWNAEGNPSAWSSSLLLPAGSYQVDFLEFEGVIDFGLTVEVQGSCCINSGCTSTEESPCDELGGTWTEGGSCDDCEPMADDCPPMLMETEASGSPMS